MHNDDDHDGGLGRDLRLFRDGLIARRRALSLIGMAAGSVAIAGGSSLLFPRAAHAAGTCVADAPEIAGPFPADGTNHASGETSDVLTKSGVVRRDVRRSFLTTATKAKGVKIHLKLKLVNTNAQCAPLAGYAVYFWHCDRDGLYSLYTIPQESYLRGVQVSDENGELDFVTVFPGCYPGRWPHLHLENFTSLAEATTGGTRSSRRSWLCPPMSARMSTTMPRATAAASFRSRISLWKRINASATTRRRRTAR